MTTFCVVCGYVFVVFRRQVGSDRTADSVGVLMDMTYLLLAWFPAAPVIVFFLWTSPLAWFAIVYACTLTTGRFAAHVFAASRNHSSTYALLRGVSTNSTTSDDGEARNMSLEEVDAFDTATGEEDNDGGDDDDATTLTMKKKQKADGVAVSVRVVDTIADDAEDEALTSAAAHNRRYVGTGFSHILEDEKLRGDLSKFMRSELVSFMRTSGWTRLTVNVVSNKRLRSRLRISSSLTPCTRTCITGSRPPPRSSRSGSNSRRSTRRSFATAATSP